MLANRALEAINKSRVQCPWHNAYAGSSSHSEMSCGEPAQARTALGRDEHEGRQGGREPPDFQRGGRSAHRTRDVLCDT